MIGKLLLGFWILKWISLYGDPVLAEAWSTIPDESLDERNDAEIFRSVVESMRQWTIQNKLHHRAKREVSKVCYEDVGCFEDTGPFGYLGMLPSPPEDVGTRFLVYGSRKARSIPMEVPAEDINDNAHRAIDPDLPTKVIVHGFGSSCDHVWVYEMRSALMTAHECNIVCVDWGPGSAVPNYVRAAANTRLVGRQLAKLIRSLDVSLERVHMIGFSLGAHVAGFAGAELGNVSRITGLDPAGPLFESQDAIARLDKTDANFVDVIHSNGEQLILGGLGSWQPMGDVDFYPNGGRMQTGCSNLFLGAVSDIIWSSAVEGRSLCNHRRAYKLFTDSVSPKCRFPAFPCPHGYDGLLSGDCFPCGTEGAERPCGDMGYYSDESPARGQLYLVTRDEEPFCAHQYQVRVHNSRSERPTRSYGKLQVTVVGEGSFNDTFAMTRKDEELLVGAILQKIVVPHPAISNLEAIEIKYTAYSGWISSGLVSWSIDKLAIVDSFGKVLSVCKRGLSLESGKPVYLPLFPGDCDVHSKAEHNSTSAVPLERLSIEKSVGIGPFTREQNYESKKLYQTELQTKDRGTPSRGMGPFTKEENLRVVERKESFRSSGSYEDANNSGSSNPWSILDISGDGDTNSLESADFERERAFDASNFIAKSSSEITVQEPTTEILSEIREPVLRVDKKETGRSLKLGEITEPILKPRLTRQNSRNDVHTQERQTDETEESSATSSVRAFTVQFLPERIAGILAQAEKYARQTLLPLISQYTPSFVGGMRQEEPKYFPPLGEFTSADEVADSGESTRGSQRESKGRNEAGDSEESSNISENRRQDEFSSNEETARERQSASKISAEVPEPVQVTYPSEASSSNVSDSEPEKIEAAIERVNDEWVPMSEPSSVVNEAAFSRRQFNVSRSLELENDRHNRSAKSDAGQIDVSTDGWVPVTVREKERIPMMQNATLNVGASAAGKMTEVTDEVSSGEEVGNANEAVTTEKNERKYIPLIDIEERNDFFASTGPNALEPRSSTLTYSHIQKIPRPTETREKKSGNVSVRRAMIFPYAYERKNDPRTRYIPLIPEEDMGRSRVSMERER